MKAATDNIGTEIGVKHASGLIATLNRAADVLKKSVSENSPLVAKFESLRARLLNSNIHLAALGQFKRGKSSFINALLGAPLLPMAVVPLTSVPIFISWRSAALIRVSFNDSRSTEEFSADDPDAMRGFLHRFVAEEANPENRLAVDRVDLFYPAPILRGGAVLIDTPGVGSTYRHNTEAAIRILPECDAVLFVVSADPPITETELEYLRCFESKTSKLLFVLNKIDYLRPDERARVVEFLQRVLQQNNLWPSDARIFCVSARDGLEAKQRCDPVAIRSSGMTEVEAYLTGELAKEKNQLLDRAVQSKACDILFLAETELTLRIRAMKMPLEDLAHRSQAFEQALGSIAEQRKTTRDLLMGERRRVREALEQRVASLRRDASRKLDVIVDASITAESDAWGRCTEQAISEKMSEIFDEARQELATFFAKMVDLALSTQQARINALIASVRRTAAELFDVPFREYSEPASFELAEEPYWVTEDIAASLIPDPSRLFDRFLTKTLRMRRVRARVIQTTNELLVRNAENLRWAILRGIEETFRQASTQFEERLDDAVRATRNVIQDALGRRRDRSFAVAAELDRLESAESLLEAVRKEFDGAQTRQGASRSEPQSANVAEAAWPIEPAHRRC